MKYCLIIIIYINNIKSVYGQNFADQIKTDWSIEVFDRWPDTLILYHNLKLIRVQKYYRTWEYEKNNMYLEGDLDNREVGMHSITELIRVRWKLTEKEGDSYLKMKYDLRVVTYHAIPIWKNDSLENVNLIRIKTRKRMFWCHFPVWYKKGRNKISHLIWRYF